MSDGADVLRQTFVLGDQPARAGGVQQQFCDEQGNMARHPHVRTWPETMLSTVTLAEEAADETRVTVSWQPYGAATLEAN
jgi:hypothetical protein